MDFLDRRDNGQPDHLEFAVPAAGLNRVRVGSDVVALTEISDSVARFGDRYLHTVYTDAELADCAAGDRIAALAARFAAKEAVIKAFATPDAAFPLREIAVAKSGPLPYLTLSGSLADLAKTQHWQSVSLSLTHTDCHAAAAVFVLCTPAPAAL